MKRSFPTPSSFPLILISGWPALSVGLAVRAGPEGILSFALIVYITSLNLSGPVDWFNVGIAHDASG